FVYMMYKSDVISDFTDYTVSSRMRMAKASDLQWKTSGFAVRANFPASDLSTSSTMNLFYRPNVGATVAPINNYSMYTYQGRGFHTLGDAGHTEFAEGGKFYSNDTAADHTVSTTVSGEDVVMSVDGNVLFDSTKTVYLYNVGVDPVTNTEYTSFATDYAATVKTDAGMVGFVNREINIEAYDFTVKLNITSDSVLPEMAKISDEDINVTPDGYIVNVSLNSKAYLPSTIYGFNATWGAAKNEYFEVYENGGIVALKEGTETISCTLDVNGNGVQGEVTVTVGDYDDEAASKFINSDKATVAPTDTDGKYVITFVDDAYVKYDTFTVNNSADIRIDELEETPVSSGKSFVFNVADYGAENLNDIWVRFETTDADTQSSAVYTLGATIPEIGYGVRFTSRIPAIKYSTTTDNVRIGALTDSIVIDGKSVTPVKIGALLIPEVLLGENTLTLSESYVNDLAAGTEVTEVTVGNYDAKNVTIKNLSDITAIYADYNVLLKDMPESMKDKEIAYRNYIIYEIDGTYAVKYEDVVTRSYEDVEIAIGAVVPTSLKVLAIGNSFSEDATRYLWDICNDAGIADLTIANMYIGGCSLDTHWENLQTDAAAYRYDKNTTGSFERTQGYKLSDALADEDWDVITIQQASWMSSDASTYTNLENILNKIKETNPNAKILWHATWSYAVGYGSTTTDVKQMEMYNNIISAVHSEVLTQEHIDGVIPSGTAIQNMRTSYIGDWLNRDGTHMSEGYGRYTTAMTWFAAITGCSINDIDWVTNNYTAEFKLDGVVIDSSTRDKVTDLKVVKEAVKNAIKNPYSVTESYYTVQPQ
ncbi:MAG: DUF4886 domain-containing protein, partial [Ruminococcaceae bacterium]|nr:DUF4886 domain-containing protein [Oscillospiraceae bacterium]